MHPANHHLHPPSPAAAARSGQPSAAEPSSTAQAVHAHTRAATCAAGRRTHALTPVWRIRSGRHCQQPQRRPSATHPATSPAPAAAAAADDDGGGDDGAGADAAAAPRLARRAAAATHGGRHERLTHPQRARAARQRRGGSSNAGVCALLWYQPRV